MRDVGVRWAGAGPERAGPRHLDFPQMPELCFRGGSREAVRKLCQ